LAKIGLKQEQLSDKEIEELDSFLLDQEGLAESMDVATLDGFLTAILCDPKTISIPHWRGYLVRGCSLSGLDQRFRGPQTRASGAELPRGDGRSN